MWLGRLIGCWEPIDSLFGSRATAPGAPIAGLPLAAIVPVNQEAAEGRSPPSCYWPIRMGQQSS